MNGAHNIPSSRKFGPLWVLLASLLFSTLGTAQALAPAEAAPFTIGAIRMFGGGLVLLIWCAFRNLLPTRYGWYRIETLVCVIGLFGFQLSFFEGITQVGVAVGTVSALGITPIATGLFCFLFFRERLTIRWFLSTSLALLGLVLLTLTGENSIKSLQGLLLTTMAGLCFSSYIIASKRLVVMHHPTTLTMVLSLLTGICLLPLALAHPLEWMTTLHGFTVSLHFSIVTVAMAFAMLVKGLQTTPAPIAATLGLAEPLGAALLGIFLLKEPLPFWAFVGMGCMFMAIIGLLLPIPHKNSKT